MNRGQLSDYFQGAAVKRLSAVDADPSRSNQHEIGTTAAMRRFLGESFRTFPATFMWIGGEQESITETGEVTLYDSRAKQTHRGPEWRLYYPRNAVVSAMKEGDTLFLLAARHSDNQLLFIVTPAGSTVERQLLWLFGFDGQPSLGFDAVEISGNRDAELTFVSRLILDEIGVEYEDPNANTVEAAIERFGTTFPSTVAFSDYARLTLPQVDARDGPDAALMAWLEHEEAMFRALERKVVAARLQAGFVSNGSADVDGFLSFSLSVQNRRKSRMGRSFENHLAAVFDACGLRYTKQATTERGNRPDFVFPDQASYADPTFPVDQLSMLAAKSTCKERWRQILPEAERISIKHLATLEPGISEAQTNQMVSEQVQLVVPLAIQSTYTDQQRAWLWSVDRFITHVRASQ